MHYEATIIKDTDGFNVTFADLAGAITCGDSLEEALAMAEEALNLYLSYPEDKAFNKPTITKQANTYPIKVHKNIAFALTLRWQREEAKLTQNEMASRLKINQSAYQRLEDTAKSNPTLKLIEKVENALQATLVDIDSRHCSLATSS
jgi:antitoxin HicB